MYSEGDIRSPGTLRFVNKVNESISAAGARTKRERSPEETYRLISIKKIVNTKIFSLTKRFAPCILIGHG